MDCHRSRMLDKYIGQRIMVTRPHGWYMGYLNYADGFYFMEHPSYKSKMGDVEEWRKWSFRKNHIKAKDIRKVDDSATFSRGI